MNTSFDEKKYKDLLLKTLSEFIQFCETNSLHYVAAYGTILGTVRHKGLIPWDDDIDVFMLREDYEKFISLKNDQSLGNNFIIDLNDKNYYLPFAKFCNKESSIWEVKELECVIGVFIDVFPLDAVSDDVQYCQNLQNSNRILLRKYIENIRNYSFWEHPLTCLKTAIKRIMFNNSSLSKKLEENKKRITDVKGEQVAFYGSIVDDISNHHFPLKWITDTISVDFENMKIIIPKDYDSYLKMCYGDYMQLPPIEKRVSHHFHYYVNLECQKSIEKIKNILRDGK